MIASLLSKVLAWKFVASAVQAYGVRQRPSHLYNKPEPLIENLYMARWTLIDEGTFASRVLKFLSGYESVRLHWILEDDGDSRDMHSHPFEYRTFVLAGWYAERYRTMRHIKGDYMLTTLPAHYRRVNAGDTAQGGADYFHSIREVAPTGVWTLFFMTKHTRTWGFAVRDHLHTRFVDSVRYLMRKGYSREQILSTQKGGKHV